MTQYVEKFPLPDPSTKRSIEIISLTKQIYSELDSSLDTSKKELELDKLVWKVFGF